jgi:ParB/RepB/Spo0J family partition protein
MSRSSAGRVERGPSSPSAPPSAQRHGPVALPLTKLRHPRDPHRQSIDAERVAALAADIGAVGLLQPIGVVGPAPDGFYEIAFGDRRTYAHELLGRAGIDAYVWPLGTNPLDIRASENTHHEPLAPLEEGAIAARYVAQGLPLAHVAHKLGHTQAWVAGRLALLDYPEDVRAAIASGVVPLTVAAVLVQIEHEAYRHELLAEAIRTGANAKTAAVWLAHWQADGARLAANHNTIEHIAASRDTFRLMVDCEGCHESVDLTTTRSYRFCTGCAATIFAPDPA